MQGGGNHDFDKDSEVNTSEYGSESDSLIFRMMKSGIIHSVFVHNNSHFSRDVFLAPFLGLSKTSS